MLSLHLLIHGSNFFALAVQKFLFYALKYYFTEVDGVDIRNAPEEVRRRINLWVEVQTHGKNAPPADFFKLNRISMLGIIGSWTVASCMHVLLNKKLYIHFFVR